MPANYAVTITETNSPVAQQEALEVSYVVENTGDAEGQQNIEFAFETVSNVVDSFNNIILQPGATFEGSFDYEIAEDIGNYDIFVISDDSTATETIEVTLQQNRPVAFPDTISPIVEQRIGDTLAEGEEEIINWANRQSIEVSAETGEVTMRFYNDDGVEAQNPAIVKPGFPFDYNFDLKRTYPNQIGIENTGTGEAEFNLTIKRV